MGFKKKNQVNTKVFFSSHTQSRVSFGNADMQLERLLLLLSRFTRVRLCATPWTAAYQASPSMGFSKQEHWSGLPFPSPATWFSSAEFSRSVVSESLRPHESQLARPPCPSPTPGVHLDSVHRVSDAIQPSHPLLSPSPPAPIPPSIRVFSNESTLRMRWPQ